MRLPLRKNSEAHDFHAEVGRFIARYYSAICKDARDLAQSWHVMQVLFHVSALFRACARMAIEYQLTDFKDPEEARHVFGGFYTVFAAHDELLSALRERRLGLKSPPHSRLLEIVTTKLARHDEVRGKFFQRQNRVPTEGYWLIPIRSGAFIDYLLPTLNVLQDIEEVLFQALALGKARLGPGGEPGPL